MNDFKKECLNLINSIIDQQRIICRICIKLYGENADITKNALSKLGKYSMALQEYKERCKANETA